MYQHSKYLCNVQVGFPEKEMYGKTRGWPKMKKIQSWVHGWLVKIKYLLVKKKKKKKNLKKRDASVTQMN